jgi:hypothetical protein
MSQQRTLEGAQRQIRTALPLFAMPIPMSNDVAGQDSIRLIGMIAERVRDIDIESGSESGRDPLQQRVSFVRVGGSGPDDRAVIKADPLALRMQNPAGENMIRDSGPKVSHDIAREPGHCSDAGDKWVLWPRPTGQRGQPDKVVRERKAFYRSQIGGVFLDAERSGGGCVGRQKKPGSQQVAVARMKDRQIERRRDQRSLIAAARNPP